jgi:hypothetical protein
VVYVSLDTAHLDSKLFGCLVREGRQLGVEGGNFISQLCCFFVELTHSNLGTSMVVR